MAEESGRPMRTAQQILQELAQPFPAKDIDWRVGATTKDKSKGMMLPYITARAVMERLDEVIGFDRWEDSYTPVMRQGSKGWLCTLVLEFDDSKVIARQDGADETDIEPTKGGISDALKRAAVKFGIGRYLYRLEPFWVPLKDKRYPVYTPDLPEWALPDGSGYPGKAPEKRPVMVSGERPRKAKMGSAPRLTQPEREDLKCDDERKARAAQEARKQQYEPDPKGDTGWIDSPERKKFVGDTEERYWKAGPNEYIVPELIEEGEIPNWFSQPHGKPGKNPIQGCPLEIPVEEMTWEQFSHGSFEGSRFSYLVWEIERFDPPGRDKPPAWAERHEDRIGKAKAVVLHIATKLPGDEDPDRGQNDRERAETDAEAAYDQEQEQEYIREAADDDTPF